MLPIHRTQWFRAYENVAPDLRDLCWTAQSGLSSAALPATQGGCQHSWPVAAVKSGRETQRMQKSSKHLSIKGVPAWGRTAAPWGSEMKEIVTPVKGEEGKTGSGKRARL